MTDPLSPLSSLTSCDLHIPYKTWADEPQEEENYNSIERWALNFRKNCLPKPGASGAVTIHRYVANNLDRDDWVVGTGTRVRWGVVEDPSFAIGSALVPDDDYPRLTITVPGMLSWAGYIHIWNPSYVPPTTSPFGGTVTTTFSDQEQIIVRNVVNVMPQGGGASYWDGRIPITGSGYISQESIDAFGGQGIVLDVANNIFGAGGLQLNLFVQMAMSLLQTG